MKNRASAISLLAVALLLPGCWWRQPMPPCSRSNYFSQERLDVVCERLAQPEALAQMLMVSPGVTNTYLKVCSNPELREQTELWTETFLKGNEASRAALSRYLIDRCKSESDFADLLAFVGRIPPNEQEKGLDCSSVSHAYEAVIAACKGPIHPIATRI